MDTKGAKKFNQKPEFKVTLGQPRGEQAAKNQLKLSKGVFSRYSFVFLVVLQLLAIYLLFLWGYHNNRFGYKFDNFVQHSGIWVIFGKKTYQQKQEDFSVNAKSDLVKEGFTERFLSGRLAKTELSADQTTLTLTLDRNQADQVQVVVDLANEPQININCLDYKEHKLCENYSLFYQVKAEELIRAKDLWVKVVQRQDLKAEQAEWRTILILVEED